MKKLMVALLAAIAVGCAWAATETVGGYTWTYRINGNTAEIYNSSDDAANSPSSANYDAIRATPVSVAIAFQSVALSRFNLHLGLTLAARGAG